MDGSHGGQVSLRATRSSVEDGLMFAHLLDESQEGKFRIIQGRGWDRMVAQAFLDSDNDLAYENVTFAEIDGATVGMGSGYTSEAHGRFTHEPLASLHHIESLEASWLLPGHGEPWTDGVATAVAAARATGVEHLARPKD